MPIHRPTSPSRQKLDALNLRLVPAIQVYEAWAGGPEGLRAAQEAAPLLLALFQDGPQIQDIAWQVPARGLVSMISRHPAAQGPASWQGAGDRAYLRQFTDDPEPDARLQAETAALLAAGLLGQASFSADPDLFVDALLAVAFEADNLSLTIRRSIFRFAKGWESPSPVPGTVFPFRLPPRELPCVAAIRHGLGATASWLRRRQRSGAPVLDATGIQGLFPASGTAEDVIAIRGQFPAAPLPGHRIVFTDQGGGLKFVSIDSWQPTEIRVRAPHDVGEGPVALALVDADSAESANAPLGDFPEALGLCLSPGARNPITGFVGLAGVLAFSIAVGIPRLPGDINVFHGGPILTGVPTPSVGESDTVIVEGLNLEPSDQLLIGDVPIPGTLVAPNRFHGSLTGQAVPGGVQRLRIGRRRGASRRKEIRVLPSVVPWPGARGEAGKAIEVEGFGFSQDDLGATINGQPARVSVVGPRRLAVDLYVPLRNPPVSNPDGEVVELALFDRGRPLGQGPVVLETFRIVSFGDSIMWGQGLLESEKFTTLVATSLWRTSLNPGGRIVHWQDRSANSGASIVVEPGGPPDFACGASPSAYDMAPVGQPQNLIGEKNCGATSVVGQVAQWAAVPADVRARVRLVLVNGGINDIGVTNLLNPLNSVAWVMAEARRYFAPWRSMLLAPPNPGLPQPAPSTSVLALFPNATIVVLGYYPLASADTDVGALLGGLTALGVLFIPTVLLAGGLQWTLRKVADISEAFARTANELLAEAVAAANDPRVRFAVPAWRPEYSALASAPRLFGLAANGDPEDPVAAERGVLCQTPCGNTHLPPARTCQIASLGHPNALGARAYADAILAAL